MSFDAKVYFSAVPVDFAKKWQAALRELGRGETVLIEPGNEQRGSWFLLDNPSDQPEDSFAIEVGPVNPQELATEAAGADEKAMLATLQHVAYVSTRLSAGSLALMVAGSIAKVTNGVVVEYQGAAFEKAFDADLAAHRGPRGPEGQPTLTERGFYDARLAWEVAKAAAAYERRTQAKSDQPVAAEAPKQKNLLPSVLFGAGLLLWALYKLHKAGYF